MCVDYDSPDEPIDPYKLFDPRDPRGTKRPKKDLRKKRRGEPHVHLPKNSDVNFTPNPMSPPTVFYEQRKAVYDRNILDKIIGGEKNGDE